MTGLLSVHFLIFLAMLCVVYFLVPKRAQWIVLLIGSYVFYIAVGGFFAFGFVLISTAAVYGAARVVSAAEAAEPTSGSSRHGSAKRALKKNRTITYLCVAFVLALLIWLKYLPHPDGLLLPLGISFYTLQAIGYLLDVYHGKACAEANFFRLSLFISYFPQIVQGPFSRFGELSGQLLAGHGWDALRARRGMERMLWGYFMKLVIADRLAVVVGEVFSHYADRGYVGLTALIGVMAYSVQIYADFLGGMHIVTGVSEIFGIVLPENFRQPFFAKSVADFWRRWHITLGEWMKTYVFYPLALSPAFTRMGQGLRRRGYREAARVVPASIASFIVFWLVGLWHGASSKYVVYALYQAVMVSSNTLFDAPYRRLRELCHINAESGGWQVFQMLRTFFLVLLGRYFSRADSLYDALAMLRATVSVFNPRVLIDGTLLSLGLGLPDIVLALALTMLLLFIDIKKERGENIRDGLAELGAVGRWAVYFALFFGIIVFGMYGSGYDVRDFMYQGF